MTKVGNAIKTFAQQGGIDNVRKILDAVRDDGKITKSEAAELRKAADTFKGTPPTAASKLALEFFNQVVEKLAPPETSFNWVQPSDGSEAFMPAQVVGDEQFSKAVENLLRDRPLADWAKRHPEMIGFDKHDVAYVHSNSDSGYTSYTMGAEAWSATSALLKELKANPQLADKPNVEPLDLLAKKLR